MDSLQEPRLLCLPAELRNLIYDDVAYTTKAVSLPSHGSGFKATPAPLSQVCHQLRQEFMPLLDALPLEFASSITIHNTNFCTLDLVQSLSLIPNAAPCVKRTIVVRFHLTDSLTIPGIKSFTKHFSGPYESTAPPMRYDTVFAPEAVDTPDLDMQRLVFARLAKQYRFHHSDGEQRVWEQIYWSFAEAAEKVDGVGVRQFAMGCWKSRGGGMRFV
ncbi:hypothetical protein LTR85_001342 [Meristemomyces frigidus]|nr:hypothetical protein LTR85_001342 [Meristemomyces frigidus]